VFGRALKRFQAYPATYLGFDLAAQRREIEDRLRQIRSGAVEAGAEPPAWRFDLPPRGDPGSPPR
jgi:hypothetical protein